ncbi:MAG TPA: hypothetical protein VF631_07880 [Allosphingosinicella sp.]|jgi:hypothetical protein|uniref:hypothetical protein n=1 Tax=Allosphingosinicella sp. TaxID=2823234 RepID=UPI002F28567D
MVEWTKVVIPGVPDSHLGLDGGLLCAEVDTRKLLEEQRRAHPVRSFFEKLRGRPAEPERNVLQVWRRAYDGDYTVTRIVYDGAGALVSVKHTRVYATDDITGGSPVETLVPRTQQEIRDEIRAFFAGAPGADRLMAQLPPPEGAAV